MKDLLLPVDTVYPGPEIDSPMEVVVEAPTIAIVNSIALQDGNGRKSPAVTLGDHSKVSSASDNWDQWDDSPLISWTSVSSLKQNAESETPQHHASNHPGMAPPSQNVHIVGEVASPQNDLFTSPRLSLTLPIDPPSQPLSSITLPVNVAKVPPSPRRHSRIPSTGSRITVMEVSQSLNDVAMSQNPLESCTSPINSVDEPDSPVEITSRTTLSQIQAEKRKSSYEKYSAIILPPLKEEPTPTQTPLGTLTRIKENQHQPSIDVERQGVLSTGRSTVDTELPIAGQTKDIIYLGK